MIKPNAEERQDLEPFLSKFHFTSTLKPAPTSIHPMEILKEMRDIVNGVFESSRDGASLNSNKKERRDLMRLSSPHMHITTVRNVRTPALLIRVNKQKNPWWIQELMLK